MPPNHLNHLADPKPKPFKTKPRLPVPPLLQGPTSHPSPFPNLPPHALTWVGETTVALPSIGGVPPTKPDVV